MRLSCPIKSSVQQSQSPSDYNGKAFECYSEQWACSHRALVRFGVSPVGRLSRNLLHKTAGDWREFEQRKSSICITSPVSSKTSVTFPWRDSTSPPTHVSCEVSTHTRSRSTIDLAGSPGARFKKLLKLGG